MPNHVTSRLSVSGDPAEVASMFAAIGGEHKQDEPVFIDFNKLIPMPKSLDIEASSDTEMGLALYQIAYQGMENAKVERWAFERIKQCLELANCAFSDGGIRRFITTERGQELYKLGNIAADNIANYGAKTWYEWCNREWGTKWNAYGQQSIDNNTIEFQTAWSGVPNLIEKLSEKFPSLTFTYMYADEDWGSNVGEFTFEGGQCVDVNLPAYGTDEANAIATELLGGPWCENEDVENEESYAGIEP